jgi:hypothetical protein
MIVALDVSVMTFESMPICQEIETIAVCPVCDVTDQSTSPVFKPPRTFHINLLNSLLSFSLLFPLLNKEQQCLVSDVNHRPCNQQQQQQQHQPKSKTIRQSPPHDPYQMGGQGGYLSTSQIHLFVLLQSRFQLVRDQSIDIGQVSVLVSTAQIGDWAVHSPYHYQMGVGYGLGKKVKRGLKMMSG